MRAHGRKRAIRADDARMARIVVLECDREPGARGASNAVEASCSLQTRELMAQARLVGLREALADLVQRSAGAVCRHVHGRAAGETLAEHLTAEGSSRVPESIRCAQQVTLSLAPSHPKPPEWSLKDSRSCR